MVADPIGSVNMTLIVKCDECGREEIIRGHLPFGWHSETWDNIIKSIIEEKQICPECWSKIIKN